MNEYIWHDFKKGRVAINCKTREESKSFIQLMNDKGYKWESDWYCEDYCLDLFKERICYNINNNNKVFSSSKEYYIRNDFQVHTYKELMTNLKIGMKVKQIKTMKNLDCIGKIFTITNVYYQNSDNIVVIDEVDPCKWIVFCDKNSDFLNYFEVIK